jgi:hypothetical protein
VDPDVPVDPYEQVNRPAAHCPNCGAEYRSGFDTCADCGVPLEPGPAPQDPEGASTEPEPEAARPDAWAEATERVWGRGEGGGDGRDEDGNGEVEPVAVARLPLQEAMLLVGRLEEAGVPARVESDASPYFVEALNVLKAVLVPRTRLEDARRVVAEIAAGHLRI